MQIDRVSSNAAFALSAPRHDRRDRGRSPALTTFLTMAYIIFVQPAVLSAAGMDFGAVLVATCLSTALATTLMALLGELSDRRRAGDGPQLLLRLLGRDRDEGAVAGGARRGRDRRRASSCSRPASGCASALITAIPTSLKHAIAAGIGLLIATIGLQWAGLIVASPGTLVTLGDLHSRAGRRRAGRSGADGRADGAPRARRAALGHSGQRPPSGLPLGVVQYQGIASAAAFARADASCKLDIAGALAPGMMPVVFVFFFLALFDSVGTLVGVGEQAGLMRDGTLPRAREALLADAVGTVAGATLGTSTVTAYIESGAGVAAGGRTGLTSARDRGAVPACRCSSTPLVRMIGGGYVGGRDDALSGHRPAARSWSAR